MAFFIYNNKTFYMQLAKWLQKDTNINDLNILGLNSFETFLKVCSNFTEWALDDIGLANRSNSYKVWICKVPADKIQNVKSVLERYSSMRLLLHYYNTNIVENNNVSFYIRLNWEENKWMISYGITNNRKLYKIGEFDYTFNTKLPEHTILKYINEVVDDFDPRKHLSLFKIKQSCETFNPGYCQITDPQLINDEVVISTYKLGQWIDSGQNRLTIENGEPEKYLQIFKDWVKTQKWWNLVHLIIVPRKNGWMDFKIKLK